MPITRTEFREIHRSYAAFGAQLKAVLKQQRTLEAALRAYRSELEKLASQTSQTEKLFDSAIGPTADQGNKLMDATKQMQETEMSFNLQYLQLQSQMQHENRTYTAVSNIMKTKHDTVKNSISNIR